MTDIANNASVRAQHDTPGETVSAPDIETAADKGNAAAVDKRMDGRLLLATYVDAFTSPSFTDEAKAQMVYEIMEYSEELRSLAAVQRRADSNAEKVMRKHVSASASSLGRKSDGPADRAADWSKWIGFTWLGFTVAQYLHIRGEQHISTGSLNWFVVDLVITAALLSVAVVLNRPWGYFTDHFRRK
jgi:hypothetical protein